jgi:hypothetical protein
VLLHVLQEWDQNGPFLSVLGTGKEGGVGRWFIEYTDVATGVVTEVSTDVVTWQVFLFMVDWLSHYRPLPYISHE